MLKEKKRYNAILNRYKVLKAHGIKTVTMEQTDAVFKQGKPGSKKNVKSTKKTTKTTKKTGKK